MADTNKPAAQATKPPETTEPAAQQKQPRSATSELDPRFSRAAAPNTLLVCGYDESGNARNFNLLKGEALPEGYSDAPPAGAHPNVPKQVGTAGAA